MPLGLSALIWALVLCYSAAFGTEALENGHLGVKCRQKILQLVGTMGQKMTVLFTFEEECKTDCTNMLYKDGTKIAEKDQNPHDPRLSYEWQKNITMTIDVLQLNDTAIYYSVIYSPGSSKILRESNCVNLTVVTEDISQENQTVSVACAILICDKKHSGPTYESLQDVFNKKSFRPAFNLSSPTITNISFTLYAVLGVNEKTQLLTTFLWLRLYWHHEFLQWDPEACGGVSKISLPVEELWTPDIIVYEFIDEDKSQRCPYVYVNHTGQIRYDRMLRVVSSCNLEIFNFPFDVQNCTLTFGSYMHTIRDVRVSTAIPFEQISANSKKYLETSGEWELVVIQGESDILKFGIDEWDIITFWVVIKRRPILYVVNLLIPSAFLMVIDILSFLLPPHSVDRASFKMTLILGYTVFLLIMNDLLPSTANGTPLIGIYFSVCLAFMVMSLLETVIITNILHHNAMKYEPVPDWVRVVFLNHIARLICYKHSPKPSETPSTTGDFSNNELKPYTDPGEKIKNIEVPFIQLPSLANTEVQQISRDLASVRSHLDELQIQQSREEEWIHVGYILDFLLFRVYLFFILAYALVIICTWCIWFNM
ncbi:5-hydroxytryptamine receptor 3A-like [Polypterus senegalus]|uniref:5-hydroxytryptamine receptor 3A-like n=1 Tax=Polypterus senegalus TaxID=55291 RepID=UPI00196615C0|nr:5-hydroxytryptamine receptor 3A-like [Polypterus senegalus]